MHNTLTFFRDINKKEIDLIIESGSTITPIEIKASETIQSSFFDTLAWFQEQTKDSSTPIVIYGGDQTQQRTRGNVVPWSKLETIARTKK